MELSNDIQQDIGRLGDETILNNNNYEKIVDKTFLLFSQTSSSSSLFDSLSIDSILLNRLVSSLLTFIFECAKYDLNDANILSKFEEYNLTLKQRQQYFIEKYRQYIKIIQIYLNEKTIEYDRLIDINWRLNLHLKTNQSDRIVQPNYFLTLKKRLQYTKNIEDIQFQCTPENLQELVEKLKEAAHCLERFTTTPTTTKTK